MNKRIFGKYGWIHEYILRPLARPYWKLRAKWIEYRYFKKYGITIDEAMKEFGKYIILTEKKAHE